MMPADTPTSITGLIAAAGRATRLAPLPCSKELLPVGYMRHPQQDSPRPKAVSRYLVEQMQRAGATRLALVLRPGKWDIADHYGDGSTLGMSMAYFQMGDPWGPPFTAAQALPWLAGATVLFGFPDILVDPPDALAQVHRRLAGGEADLVLGLCPMPDCGLSDLVHCDVEGRITRLSPKESNPPRGPSDRTWMLAAWRPRFSRFLQDETARLAAEARRGDHGPAPEWPFGAIISAALDAGLSVEGCGGSHWQMLDTGTPEGLVAAPDFPGVWSGRGAPGSS